METDDTQQGGEGLSIEQAVAGYVKATATEAIPKDDAEVEEETDGTTTDDELQTSDEGEGEETDGETASEDDAAESDDDEPESDQGRFVADNAKVRLPDGTVTTVHELKRGNLREADYTRKRQEDAALSAETAAEREALEASKKQIDEERAYFKRLVQSIIPDEPDPALYATDPYAHGQQKLAREEWLKHLTYLDQQDQQTAKERAAKFEADQRERGQREWDALLGALPELKAVASDEKELEKRLDKFTGDLKRYGKTYGFTPQEIASVALDHRQAVVLSKAIKWDKLQASKAQVAKKVEGRPPVQKGGKRLNPGDHRARQATDAMNRLKQSGSVEDATAAYLASLNKG
jgi:hypothetical protein